ncbi:MAG TPA: 6-phosphofructokinase, partial [Clostridia bacterium]|nr:6-phosphofructokinase [Clostridia bacterium]
LPYTDFTLGFDTAVNTVLDAIRKIRDTMTSHERISVVEVMGRASGQIAIYSGLCGGAECVIVPEIPWDINEVAQRVKRAHLNGKLGSLVVLAEGAGKSSVISEQIEKLTGIETKYTVLGHIQRGGSPSARDTQLACQFGDKAVSVLKSGSKNRVVGIKDNKIFDMDIIEALSVKRDMGKELYELTYILAK